ncbi:AbrB/MazE/SpoVT family DNA-binding domain-containing protein (plasmid) [Clostridium baratii]
MVRVTLPKEWADELKINKENSGLKLSFDGEKIIIEKV